jgi:HSP20 family protein
MAQEVRRSQSNLPQTNQSGTSLRRHGDYSPFSQSPEEFFRMSPFQLMRHFSEEMDRMWGGSGYSREGRGGDLQGWRPVVDVRENNRQLQVHAELPGVNENDVKVSVENDMLILKGERKREEERDEEGWHRSERSYGSFYRAIPLPEGAQTDKANARFNNGVLEITMPVTQAQQNVRQIPVSTSSQSNQTADKNQTPEKTQRAGGS